MTMLAVSDAVVIAVCSMIVSVLGLFVPIIAMVVKHRLDKKARAEEAKERKVVSDKVDTIEKQTNHLADLAINHAREAANKQGRLDERQRADNVADAKEVAIAVVEAKKEENAVIRRLGDPANETIAADIAEVKEAVVDAVKETGKTEEGKG